MARILLTFLIIFSSYLSFAQCLPQASCIPIGPTNANAGLFNMGIRRVILNTLDKPSSFITSASLLSYHDYSCTDSTNLIVGTAYPITVNTNGNPPTNTSNENVRIWLDLNNDSTFTSSELIFSSNNKQSHTGTVTIPATAVLNTALRMRVAAEWVGATNSIPTFCGAREYSEVEDYKVRLEANVLPPSSNFSANPRTSCNGVVQFQDLSINGPTSWIWNFGDGAISNLQNPQYTYSSTGIDTFDVTLITFNANGSDTIIKTDYIIRTGLTPAPANCSPITNAYCCSYGITNFSFGTINKTSSDASQGYQDYTCTDFTRVVEGLSYPVSFTTNPSAPEAIKVYIDLNANGSFQDPGELIYSIASAISPNANIIIPSAQLPYSTPLRMRIMSDAIGSSFNSCTNLTRGQAEDYTILIDANPFPPVAAFDDNQVNGCQSTIQFTDLSINAPNSWFWDFGDGTFDTIQNPIHTYTMGNYTAKLVVQNGNGADSTSKNFIISTGANPPACIPSTSQTFFPLDIERVVFAGISHISLPMPGNFIPYEDFACDYLGFLDQGQSYNFVVETRSPVTPSDVKAWLDYNNDGVFDNSELIFNSTNTVIHTQSVTIPTSSSITTGQAIRLRIASDFINAVNGPVPCGNLEFGQTEDYSVLITAPAVAPTADYNVTSLVTCNGTLDFTDASGFNPTLWTWNFGDGNTSSLQNVTHTYNAVGTYIVELIACNAFGCDSIQKTIEVIGLDGTKPAICTPTTASVNGNIGIFNVKLSNLNVSSNSLQSYQDFACDKFAEVVEGNAYQMNVLVGAFTNQTVEAWVDFNNNGNFTSNEKIFSKAGFSNLVDAIIMPATAVKNEFLRMRIVCSSTATNPAPLSPCNDITVGEIEDYSMIIRSSNASPVAEFSANPIQSCNGEVSFLNESYFDPASYLWNFGDGTTSILENPTHKYSNTGTYTVKLRVQNGFGVDSLIKSNYVIVSDIQGPKAASCYPLTQFSNPNFGITSVELNSINNTNTIVDGYENYTCSDTTWLKKNQNYTINVTTSTGISGNVRVYIDFNNDGIFQVPDELFLSSNNKQMNHSGNFTVPNTVDSVNKLLRMRVWSDMSTSVLPSANLIPCVNPEYGQVEDYGIWVDQTVGIERSISNQISIFPNPSSGTLTLNLETELTKDASVEIYNEIGVKVISLNMTQGSLSKLIDLQELSSGIYILKLTNADLSKTLRIIKN